MTVLVVSGFSELQMRSGVWFPAAGVPSFQLLVNVAGLLPEIPLYAYAVSTGVTVVFAVSAVASRKSAANSPGSPRGFGPGDTESQNPFTLVPAPNSHLKRLVSGEYSATTEFWGCEPHVQR